MAGSSLVPADRQHGSGRAPSTEPVPPPVGQTAAHGADGVSQANADATFDLFVLYALAHTVRAVISCCCDRLW